METLADSYFGKPLKDLTDDETNRIRRSVLMILLVKNKLHQE
jgi:hypothetical protein